VTLDDKFSLVASESHLVASLLDPIKTANWDEIERVGSSILDVLAERKSPRLAIDLSDLDYMGSSVVALMVRVWKVVQEKSGKMVVVTRHELVREVLVLAGLGRVWTIVDSLEEALDELGVSDAAVVQRRETRLLTFVGPLAAVAASCGLAILLRADSETEEYLGVISLFACALLGLTTAIISAVREEGGLRNLSVVVVLWSAGLAVFGAQRIRREPLSFRVPLLNPAEDEQIEQEPLVLPSPVHDAEPGNAADTGDTGDESVPPGAAAPEPLPEDTGPSVDPLADPAAADAGVDSSRSSAGESSPAAPDPPPLPEPADAG
jgi:anti-anti-sigma factor